MSVDDRDFKIAFLNNKARSAWALKAPGRLAELAKSLPAELSNPDRTGVLSFYLDQGVDDPFPQLVLANGESPYGEPLDSDDEIVLFDSQGKIFFEGRFADIPSDRLAHQIEFFLHKPL